MIWRAVVLMSCCLATACAGPVRTRYGGLPVAGDGVTSLALSATDERARHAVEEALHARGIGVDDGSAYELHVGASARPDPVGIIGEGGAVLAPPRKQRLFQSCHNKGYRLALAVSDRRSGAIVARGWAEESHCAASMDSVLPVLARQSVAMLTESAGKGSTLRWTKD
jgi:hypothetical protein